MMGRELEGLENEVDKGNPHPDASVTSSVATVNSENNSETITVTTTYSYRERVSAYDAQGSVGDWIDTHGEVFGDGSGDYFAVSNGGYSNNSEYGSNEDFMGQFHVWRTHTWVTTTTVNLAYENGNELINEQSSTNFQVAYKGHEEKVEGYWKGYHLQGRNSQGDTWRSDSRYQSRSITNTFSENTVTNHPNIIGSEAIGLVSDIAAIRKTKARTFYSWPDIGLINEEFNDLLNLVSSGGSSAGTGHSAVNLVTSGGLLMVESSATAATGGILLFIHGAYVLGQSINDSQEHKKRLKKEINELRELSIKEGTRHSHGTVTLNLR